MHITIVGDSSARDALRGLGPIEIRSTLFQMGSIDNAAVDRHVTIGGRRFVITSVDVHPEGGPENAVTVTVAPADDDPFEETREEKQPEW